MGLQLSPVILLALLVIATFLPFSAQSHKDCYASVGGALGHVFLFDGGHVTTDPIANECHQHRPILLTRSESSLCQFDIRARFCAVKSDGGKKLSQLTGIIVQMKGGDEIELKAGRHLMVNGHAKRVPHAAHGIRVFYSGEDLVFVHKRCHFWVTYDGHWTATYRLDGSHYGGKIDGLAGNCNGRHDDEGADASLSKWLSEAGCQRCQTPHHREAHQEAARAASLEACQRAITGHSDTLETCAADFCAAGESGNSELQKRILCADFYLHSRRSARHHRPLAAWRHRSGCPLECPANQHFSPAAKPCPDTCHSHFFGAPKRCFKLPTVEGCQCNRGFVLDGRRCVRPKRCECLAKLCVDRMPRHKCLRWRAHGRCDRYPDVMARFCRLTCGLCHPRCRNQLSDKLCDKLRSRGKCAKPFYRVVCQAACQPKLCHCPSSRRVVSKCHPRFKNRSVASLRWFPDVHGKCAKSVLLRYEPCGFCPRKVRTVLEPCNYCTQLGLGKRIVQYREQDGKRRCLRRVHSLSRKCRCPPKGYPKVTSHTQCKHHATRIRTLKLFKAAKHCSKCVRVRRRTVLDTITCPGRRTVLTKCRPGRIYHLRRELHQVARHCACHWCVTRQRKIPCRCRRPVSRTFCSEGGRHLVTVTKSWRLDHSQDRCVRRVVTAKRRVVCESRRRSWVTCQRHSCTAVRHATWHHLDQCKCVKKSASKRLGKCCCPHGYKKTVHVNHYWKKVIHVQFLLKRHKCHKQVTVTKIRIACPGPKHWAKCDGDNGAKVFTKVWFLKNGNVCIKKCLRRVETIECSQGLVRHASACHIRRGVSRYRKIVLQFSRRREGTCRCVRLRRVVEEFCGCKKGKFLVTSKCPKTGCSGGKACGPDCHFTKTFYFYDKKREHHSGKAVGCIKRVLKQIHFPCCCPSNRRVRQWCRSDKFVVKQVTYTAMAQGKHECHRFKRTISARVRCLHGPHFRLTKKLPHPEPDHYYLATYRWRLKNCRCLVIVSKRPCLKRCRAPTKKRFCDTLQRHWVTRRVSWELRGCRACVQRVSERRVPVRCRRVVRHSRHCDMKSGVLTLTASWWRPNGCGCVRQRRVRLLRCKCPKPIVGRPHCSHERHAFVKRTIYWVLKSGQCLKRRKTKVTRVHCQRKLRYKSVCRAKSGVKTVYVGVMLLNGCGCVRQWSVHNRLRCNCDIENRKVKGIVHHYCDRLRNLREAVTHRFVLRKGCCVRRTRSRIRGFPCPPPFTEKLPCDLQRRIQLTLTHFSIKRNCRCVRALRKLSRKCGCPHGPKIKRHRFCRKVPGLVVSVTRTQRWSHRRQLCVHKRVTRSHRILCSQKTHYTTSKCIRNSFYVETKVYHVRRGCRCFKRTVKRKKNCHCKSILRRYKCPKHGYTKRLVTQVMRWDSAKKRCHTVRYVTRRIRCRCPKPSQRKFCHAGAWITETTRFALRHNCCYKRVEKQERRVHCPRIVRHRYTACDEGCNKRHIYTLEQRLHPKRCACYFAVVKRRSCPCCCEKPVSKKQCVHSGTAWQRVTVTSSPLEGKQCGCQQHLSRYTRKVICSKQKTFTWLPCDRHACLSRQRVEFSVVRRCGCHRVSRFTGKQRVCCCRQKPRRKRYCSNSAIHERHVTWRLRRWRCVRRTRVRLVRRWHCPEKPKVVVGRCNHSTCHQHLHTLVNRVDWPRCRCRRIVVNPRSRLCCCLQRPRRSHHCDSATSAWVTTRIRFKFSASRCVCLRMRRVTRVPVRCPSDSRRTHRCNRHSCRRIVEHVRHSIRRCRCVRRVTKTSHVCCCPPPRRQPPRCLHHRHQWLTRRVAWRLVAERCVKRVTTVRRHVTCADHPRASIRVLSCNRHTCRQGVQKTVWRLVGCSCVAKSHVSFRTCCCRPKVRTLTQCERHKYVVRYTTRRLLDRSRYVCVNKKTKTVLHRIGNCHGYERRGKCNRKTRHRTVRVVLRRVRHCRCSVYRRIVRRYLCSCPKPEVKRTKCNKASCHRSVVKVWFTSHGHWRRFKCRKNRRVIRIRCCCKRHPGHRVFCDRHTGDIMRKDWWTVFVAESKSCAVRHGLQVVKPLTCPESSYHVSKCNKHTGYKVKECTSFSPVRHKCNCRRRVSRRRIICYCPPSILRNFCTKDKLRVFVRTSWHLSLHQNRCVKTVKRVVKHLACSKRRWRVKKCHHDCSAVWYYHKYRIRNCQCHRVTHTRRVKCCCPKPSRTKRCLGHQWLTVVTKHKLRRGHCVKIVKSRRRTLWCNRTKVRVGHCDKDCNKRRVILRFGIRQCKCVLVKRIVRVKKCCCPKPQRYKRCESAKGVIKRVEIVWHLRHGKCLKRQHVQAKQVICHGNWSRDEKCDHVTRHQKVVLVRYHRVGCRCHRTKIIQRLLCRCRPPFIVKEKCAHHKWKRSVYKVTYRLAHPHSKLAKCIKHRQLWYVEPCKCPKPSHHRKCSQDGTSIVTSVRTWRLITVKEHHHWQKVCVSRKTVRHVAVRCRGPSVGWSACNGCRKKRTTVTFRVHHCKCRRHVAVREFACNCEKKSYKRHHCDAHAGHLVYARRTCFARHGAAECSCHTRRWHVPIVCPSRRHKTLLSRRHCGIHKRHAWFSRYSLEWHTRHACGCVRHRRTFLHFCRCQHGRKRVRCSLDGKTIIVTRDSYGAVKNHKGSVVGCRHIRQVTKRRVACNSVRPRVRFGGCDAHCKRSVSVTQCFVRDCRRKHCSRSALQVCCTPKKKQRRFCEKKSGKWVRETVSYRLVPSTPLLKDCVHDHVLVHQLKIFASTRRSYRAVLCPRGSLRETCDRRTGRWQKTRISWRRVGCHCRRRVRSWRGKCKCPPKRVHWGPCRHSYKVKTVTWFVLRHHACKRHVHKRSYLCSCPKPRHYTRCDHLGAWETCHITFRLRFHQQRCQKLRSCRRRMHTCPVAVERHSNCVDCRRTIRRDTWRLNRHRCACVRTVRRRVVECDCWKKHSRSTVCQHGAFVTRIVTHRQRGERCAKVVQTVTKPVYCSKHRVKKLVPGSCVSTPGHKHCGFQKLMFEWRTRLGCKCVRKRRYRWVPCLCRLIKKYRERKFTRCLHGSVVLKVRICYTLRGHKCIKRVIKNRRQIVCKGVKNHRGPCKPNGHGDTYWTKRVWRRHSNGHCGCHWRLASVHRRICRCRPSHLLKLCVHDRIRRKIHVRYHPVPKTIHCRGRRHIQDEQLACPNAFTRKTKCHKCSFTVHKYAYGFSKCRCVRKLIDSRQLKCCCPAPVTTRHCDAKRHLFVSVTVSNHLRHHRCYRRRETRTRRLHCGRVQPLYRVSKCVHEHRKITKSVRFTVACACQVKTTHYKQRCACPHRLIYRRGKCGHWFAHDAWLGYQLKDTGLKIPGTNKPVLKCVKIVVERRKRRCRCPKPYRRSVCRTDNLIIFIAVSYHLHDNSCQRRRVVRERHLPCQKRPHLLRVIVSPSKCLAEHGYIQSKKRSYIFARRCKCHKSTRVTHRVCNCLLKHGGKKRSVKCVGPNRRVKRVVWWVHKGRGCAKRVKTSTKVLHCPKKRKVRASHCKHSTGLRSFHIYHLVIRHCKCIWQLVRHATAPCLCPKPIKTTRCHDHSSWLTVKLWWSLEGTGLETHCVKHKRRTVRPVKCSVGRRVRRSGCDHLGYRTTTITVFRLKHCRCQKRVERSRCRCRCPKNQTHRFCRHQAWVTVRLEHKLEKCACRSTRRVSRQPVLCPEKRHERGSCRRASSGDKYRKLVWTSWSGSGCQCHRHRVARRHLCGCDQRRRKQTACVADCKRVSVTSERRLIAGCCRRVRIQRRTVRIRCGRPSVRRVCHKATGELSIFVVKPFVKNCRCHRRVVKHTRKCGCHKGHKLVTIGKCNRHSCRQRLYFKRQVLDAENEKCIWRRYHRHRVCCCHGSSRHVRCEHKLGYHVIKRTKMVLRHWHCVKRVTQTIRPIKCSWNATRRSLRLKGGVLKIVDCWHVRVGCDCLKRCRTIFRRYRCKKPSKKVACRCNDGKCRIVTRLTHWRLVKGHCYRQTRAHALSTVCPPNRTSRSLCSLPAKYGYYFRKHFTVWYQKACRCFRKSHVRRIVCRCWKPQARRHCQKHQGLIVTVRVHYRLKRGHCAKIVQRKSRKVSCGHGVWRFSHSTPPDDGEFGVYYKVYWRLVRSGCYCVKQHKRTPCRSRCPACTKTTHCSSAGSEIITRKTCWHLVGCHCVRRVTTSRRVLACPRTVRRVRCHHATCALTTIVKSYQLRACQCQATKRVSRHLRCCCPKPVHTRACIKGSVVTRLVTHRLVNGRCHSSTSERHRRITCSHKRRLVVSGRCHHGKGRQRFSQHYWIRRGCKCVKQVQHRFKRCTCQYNVVDLIVAVDLHSKKAEHNDRSSYRSTVAKFLDTLLYHFKYGTAKVRTTVFVYNSAVKEHKFDHQHSLSSTLVEFTNGRTDLHCALKAIYSRLKHTKPTSGVKKIVLVITRGNHHSSGQSIALAEKIQRRAQVFVVGFGSLPKSGRYVKWLASKPRRLNYLQLQPKKKYNYLASRIFKRTCHIRCDHRRRRHVSSCNRDTCRQQVVEVEWRPNQHSGKCLKRRRTHSVACCCQGHDSNRVLCDSKHGRLIRVIVSHKFDFHKRVCHRRVQRIDISASIYAVCRSEGVRHHGVCKSDGWRRDVFVTRSVDPLSCRCHSKRRHLPRVRCRCPPTRHWNGCRQDTSGRWFRFSCELTYRLSHGAVDGCAKSRRCQRRYVVCDDRHRINFRGRCHHHGSCQRRRGVVSYSVSNCRCRRHVRTWSEVCCCKQPSRQYAFCDRHNHRHVRVHVHYSLVRGSCRRIERKVARPVGCPTVEQVRLGHKCHPHGQGFYRRVVKLSWRLTGCRCERQSKLEGWRLCRCQRLHRSATKCDAASGLVLTRRWWLAASGNQCQWLSRIASRVAVTCSAQRRKRVGPCAIAGSEGKKLLKVTIWWERRIGCECKSFHRSHTRLCACPSRVRRTTRCHDSHWLQVSFYRYELRQSSDGHASCQLVRKSHRRRVTCGQPVIRYEKCHHGKRSVHVTVFRPKHCRCVAKISTRLVGCKSQCRDLLPAKICRKWAVSSSVQVCVKHPHIASRLCSETCGLCCRSAKNLVYSGKHCLTHQPPGTLELSHHAAKDLVIARKTTFDACASACTINPHCRAFDYVPQSQVCHLLRVGRHSLGTLSPTPGCLLFEKSCLAQQPYHQCQFRRVIKTLPCRCYSPFGKKHKQLCYRRAVVAVFSHRQPGSHGACQRHSVNVRIPCSWCEDSQRWCRVAASAGKCAKSAGVRKACRHSCRQCRRHRNPHLLHRHTLGGCSKSGWLSFARGGLWYDRHLDLWRVLSRIAHLRCVQCPVGASLKVHRCTGEKKRKLTWVSVKRLAGHSGHRCKISRHEQIVDCCGGGLDLVRRAGRCKRSPGSHGGWQRQVTTHFTVLEKIAHGGHQRHRCVVRKHAEQLSCSPRCPRRHVRRGPCVSGKRVVSTRFHVTYPGSEDGHRCVPKVFTRIEPCVSSSGKACDDMLCPSDCAAISSKGMCGSLHPVCARTCGKCQ